LTRAAAGAAPPAAVRAVHLGLGAFHRAHQAWYTAGDPDAGIAAYSFRDTALPRALGEQGGLFTLLVPDADGTGAAAEHVGSISRAHPGGDTDRWLTDLADSGVGVLTMTVTEAGYQVGPEGPGPPDGAVGRVLAGLAHRHRRGAAPIALVPCDNLPGNGAVLGGALRRAAAGADPGFRRWLDAEVSLVSTVVDRITPATTDADRSRVAELTGFADRAPVVAEPFTEWLLCGDFPHGRPAWERRGARFVDDLEAFQQRKLWFLNGAHTVLAYAGRAAGWATVDEAVADPDVAALVESWWDTATGHALLPAADLADYRRRLLARFASRGVRHRLAQIAMDGSRKIPPRFLPVLAAERAAGRLPEAVVVTLAHWVGELRGGEVVDPDAERLVGLAAGAEPVRAPLAALDPALADDAELVAAVTAELTSRARSRR
jgi:fructuronate reductase